MNASLNNYKKITHEQDFDINKSQLSAGFLQAMVQSMYRYDSKLIHTPDLLEGPPLEDFYKAFMANPLN